MLDIDLVKMVQPARRACTLPKATGWPLNGTLSTSQSHSRSRRASLFYVVVGRRGSQLPRFPSDGGS